MTAAPTGYALELSDDELARYELMAATAAEDEADDWAQAGIQPGAAVVDVGCGPGAILARLADLVGQRGRAVGIDIEPGTVAAAARRVAQLPQAAAEVGRAEATGLAPGSFDVAMCRHVLAHNGGREAAIVEHLATLVRPGGAVYLVDVDMSGARLVPDEPELDIVDHYRRFHSERGSDLMVGLHLGELLEDAGLEVQRFRSVSSMFRLPPEVRGPHWAAREAMVAAGVATEEDVARWDRAFSRMERAPRRPWMFVPIFAAIGRTGRAA
jgi:SAM-dependent methyltransferase